MSSDRASITSVWSARACSDVPAVGSVASWPTAARRRTPVPIATACVGLFMWAQASIWLLLADGYSAFFIVGIVLVDLACMACAYRVIRNGVTAPAPSWFVEAVCYVLTLAVLVFDFNAAASGATMRCWPLVMVILDVVLASRLRDAVATRAARNIVIGSALWLILCDVELAAQFGLFKLDAARRSVPPLCDCDSPPCSLHAMRASLTLALKILCLVLSFHFTRRFEGDIMQEKEVFESAINTAHYIAICLSVFDVKSAEESLKEGEKKMHPGLAVAFRDILSNLRSWQPYLPSAGFALAQEDDVEEEDNEDVFDSEAAESHELQNLDPPLYVLRHPAEGLRQPALSSNALVDEPETLGKMRVTLLQTNLHEMLQHLAGLPLTVFQKYFAHVLSGSLRVVQACRGSIGLFLGDRFFATFNVTRPCPQHAAQGITAAMGYLGVVSGTPFAANVSVATGQAVCGMLGCEQMRQQCVLGKLPVVAYSLERVGRSLGIPVLCNDACQSEYAGPCHARVVFRKIVYAKAWPTKDAKGDLQMLDTGTVWEVLDPAAQNSPAPAVTELVNPWQPYNEAGEMFLRGIRATKVISSLPKATPDWLRAALAEALVSPVASLMPFLQYT